MKKAFVVIAGMTMLLTACKEKPPVIIFGAPKSVDTTYVLAPSNIPIADDRVVLVEEYTGQSCTNCPAAHEDLKKLQKDHKGRILVIGLYIYGPIQTRPPYSHGAKYDFRHEEATAIANAIYSGVGQLPSAGVDRTRVSGNIKLDKGLWAGAITDRLLVADSVNIRTGLSYNPVDTMLTIRDTIIYTKPVSYKHNLSIVVVEDSIIDVQEYPSTDPVHPGKNEEYDFTNVFRGMATSAPMGDAILDTLAVKEAGRVAVRIYKYKMSKVLKPYNCRVISFVSAAEPGTSHVMQSAEAKVK